MRVGLLKMSGSAAALSGTGNTAALLYFSRIPDVDLPRMQLSTNAQSAARPRFFAETAQQVRRGGY